MTRNTALSTDGRYGIVWGKDHACGWFIQVFDLEVMDQDSPKALVVDKDNVFDGIGPNDVVSIAIQYNAGDDVQREIFGF